ncbi:hypothetical protein KHA94_06255 [Bacillus sp. FJAT-49705]|uniref:Uncharacterized protein n=1 Tax=Cytobacillus citreus TaxID=2833586 RepID=A0ABS5NPS1_9BACI|nr:hypothetical protein [Cytobacillus citreus]MBS4189810.1 hypothetical protein [Cytobacillus citreus]
MKKKLAVMALAAGLVTTGSMAQAGTTYSGYDVIVPGFNSSGFSPQQTKSTSNASADLKVSILGKPMDARAHSHSGGTGAWVRLSTVGGPFKLPNTIKSGNPTRVEFDSDWNQTVDARVKGEWRSN